jgi:hypothetical protein
MIEIIDLSRLFDTGSLWFHSYLMIALMVSLIWGFDGVKEVKCAWTKVSHFVSDFLSGLLGFGALYLLLGSLMKYQGGIFEVFLGIVAIAGICGYGYSLVEWLKKS